MDAATSTQRWNERPATQIVAAIAAGTTTCEEVMRHSLERIAERDGDVRAFATVDPEQAIAAARLADRATRRGPLHGVPFAVKDIIDTADLPTEWGTPLHAGRAAGRDSTCVALARRAGGLLIGKAVTTEFANQHPGPSRNPLDLTRTPGGSSSGSAAAVADHMAPLAIGTQTTGSTIRPSSFCGIFGFRPTYGTQRLLGVMEASGSLDTLGLMAHSVEDIALFNDVLLGVDPVPVATVETPPRIGICRHVWDQVDPVVRERFEEAARQLERAGARISDIPLPDEFAGLTDAHRWISGFEFARTFAWEIDHHWDGISAELRAGRVADGLACSQERYQAAIDLAARCRAVMDASWGAHDVILTVGATGEAPVGWNALAGADLYKMWTALHLPTITMPVLKGRDGMPVGVQVLAPRHADRRLFSIARWAWDVLAPLR